jgi:HEAT repeat protein
MSGKFFQELLARVKQEGRLSNSELSAVRSALEAGTTDEDPYTLLHIIGKAGNQSLAPLVTRYLTVGLDERDDEDDMLRRLAIQILAQWWKRRDVFESVAKAAFQDPSPHVRSMAASALGDLGLDHPELRSQAAVLLLRGLEGYGKEDRHVWGAFYNGALTLAEVEYSKRPLRPHELTPERLDKMILKRLRSYVGRPE